MAADLPQAQAMVNKTHAKELRKEEDKEPIEELCQMPTHEALELFPLLEDSNQQENK